MRSIKTKLIWVLAGVVIIALISSGTLLIWFNAREMRKEIFLDVLSFAELTNNSIVTSFEQFYQNGNFLQFRRDVNPLLSKNIDVSRLEVIGKSGELLYDSSTETEVPYDGSSRTKDYGLERVRSVKPSLLFDGHQIVFVRKSAEQEWLAVTEDDQIIDFPEGKVVDIIFPHRNARLSVVYQLDYSALWNRTAQMAISVLGVLAAGIFLASFFGISFAGRLLRPLKELERGVVQIGKGAFGSQVVVSSNDEIGILAQNFNQMSKTLKRNTEELLEKEKLTRELNIARDIQRQMLPEKAPTVKNLDVAGSVTPASLVGGDIYDYLNAKNGDLLMFISDVTGHGVPAGMIASITNSCLWSYATTVERLDEILVAMNRVVYAKTGPSMFATALLSRWDAKTRQIRYCNAGHEQIMHYQAKTQTIRLIGKGGMALGMIADLKKLLKEESLTLEKGDVMLLYTDGIPEAWKDEKNNLGLSGFSELARKVISRGQTAETIRKNILEGVNRFRKNFPQKDDITLIVAKAL